MRRATTIGLAVTASAAAVAVALGGGGVLALGGADDGTTPAQAAATRPAEPDATATREPEPAPDTSAPAPPAPLLVRGDTGRRVRELQHRLFQLAWLPLPTTGRFDAATAEAVRGFQEKRGFEVTGEVDRRTWRRLLAMSREPSADELLNRAGPALYAAGDTGPEVREIQARLRQIGWFFGDVTDQYGDATVEAVSGFQGKRQIPVTGEVDRRTLDLLEGMTREPTADELANIVHGPADGAPLDPRCLTGRVLCIDKTSQSLRWVVDGTVLEELDVRFGREGMETREGQFAVSYKSRDHVSSIYDTPMPFAMFFSGGQAVHYSPDFAANGYNGASHGCVNVRDYSAIAALFDEVNVGDEVVVYWS